MLYQVKVEAWLEVEAESASEAYNDIRQMDLDEVVTEMMNQAQDFVVGPVIDCDRNTNVHYFS